MLWKSNCPEIYFVCTVWCSERMCLRCLHGRRREVVVNKQSEYSYDIRNRIESSIYTQYHELTESDLQTRWLVHGKNILTRKVIRVSYQLCHLSLRSRYWLWNSVCLIITLVFERSMQQNNRLFFRRGGSLAVVISIEVYKHTNKILKPTCRLLYPNHEICKSLMVEKILTQQTSCQRNLS